MTLGTSPGVATVANGLPASGHAWRLDCRHALPAESQGILHGCTRPGTMLSALRGEEWHEEVVKFVAGAPAAGRADPECQPFGSGDSSGRRYTCFCTRGGQPDTPGIQLVTLSVAAAGAERAAMR